MGNSESSNSESNSSKSDSELSNSGNEKGNFEIMNCLKGNENTIINRVWIAKKSISLNDRHINFKIFYKKKYLKKKEINLIKPIENVFNLKKEFNSHFKHWAIILELSNDSYVNIQFGRNGFSLEEFNKTDIEGENVLNSIICAWGEDGSPFSFCYLGNANYKYDDLKNKLKAKKNKEVKILEENGKTYYNACFNNCQHFACDIEKILFGYIKSWHSFDYYLDDFYNTFFPNINLNKLKAEYESKLYNENEKLFKLNVKEIQKIELNKNLSEHRLKKLKDNNEKLPLNVKEIKKIELNKNLSELKLKKLKKKIEKIILNMKDYKKIVF